VPEHWIYVDSSFSGTESGTMGNPYNTASEGNSRVPNNDFLWFRGGTYTGAGNTPITFTKPMLIQSYRGAAVLR